jgi:hypothetical protein
MDDLKNRNEAEIKKKLDDEFNEKGFQYLEYLREMCPRTWPMMLAKADRLTMALILKDVDEDTLNNHFDEMKKDDKNIIIKFKNQEGSEKNE